MKRVSGFLLLLGELVGHSFVFGQKAHDGPPQSYPDTVYLSSQSSVYLAFAQEIEFINIGNLDYAFQVEKGIVILKANKQGVKPSNMLIQCGNRLITFQLKYALRPKKTLYDFRSPNDGRLKAPLERMRNGPGRIVDNGASRPTINAPGVLGDILPPKSLNTLGNSGQKPPEIRVEKSTGKARPRSSSIGKSQGVESPGLSLETSSGARSATHSAASTTTPSLRSSEISPLPDSGTDSPALSKSEQETTDIEHQAAKILAFPDRLKTFGTAQHQITILLTDIFTNSSYMIFKFKLINHSSLAYALDYVSFQFQHASRYSRSTVLSPIYHTPVTSCPAHDQMGIVYVLPSFGTTAQSSFSVTFRELHGDRKAMVDIPARAFNMAQNVGSISVIPSSEHE